MDEPFQIIENSPQHCTELWARGELIAYISDDMGTPQSREAVLFYRACTGYWPIGLTRKLQHEGQPS